MGSFVVWDNWEPDFNSLQMVIKRQTWKQDFMPQIDYLKVFLKS